MSTYASKLNYCCEWITATIWNNYSWRIFITALNNHCYCIFTAIPNNYCIENTIFATMTLN